MTRSTFPHLGNATQASRSRRPRSRSCTAPRRPARGRDGPVELVAEAEVGYPLTPLDEIRIKRPSLAPLRRRFKAIAVNLHGTAPFVLV